MWAWSFKFNTLNKIYATIFRSSFLLKTKLLFYCLYVGVLLAYVCVHECVYLIPTEPRTGYWVFWDWSYRWLWIILWVLEIELQSSGREASALNYGTISLALFWIILF